MKLPWQPVIKGLIWGYLSKNQVKWTLNQLISGRFTNVVDAFEQLLGDTFVGKVIIWITIKNLFAFQLGKKLASLKDLEA
ncbi:hypothetical protein C2845_PM06G24620 [Panicum miliaceum]|uniref:Uncharacterized protein n=1 Tax=Panicum miliaceum TaxID=4540 RepID=A0A3L6R654_PANMI|nr:hypothetical protein C2845_PM06G24620 [Panicum miliaceum]